MRLLISMLCHDTVLSSVQEVRDPFDRFLKEAIGGSTLAGFDATIRYIPSILPPQEATVSRHLLQPDERAFDCEPSVDYELFLAGTFAERLNAFASGLAPAADALGRLGATPEQVADCRRMLVDVPERILAHRAAGHALDASIAVTEVDSQRRREALRGMLAKAGNRAGDVPTPGAIAFLLAAMDRSEAGQLPERHEERTGSPPAKIAIEPDGRIAEFLGRTADGRQFFLTTPFEPATGPGAIDGREFVALYLFEDDGTLLEAQIDDFGPRATMDAERRRAVHDDRLRSLGQVSIERIEVAPFAVKRFGTTFGLIPREPDFDAIEMMPGNYMCFFPPWDSGEYDT